MQHKFINRAELSRSIEATDLFCRLHLGQWAEAVRIFAHSLSANPNARLANLSEWLAECRELEVHAETAFATWSGMSRGASRGIGNHEAGDGQIAYDIHQVLRRVVASEDLHHPHSTWRDAPMQFSRLALPTVTTTDGAYFLEANVDHIRILDRALLCHSDILKGKFTQTILDIEQNLDAASAPRSTLRHLDEAAADILTRCLPELAPN